MRVFFGAIAISLTLLSPHLHGRTIILQKGRPIESQMIQENTTYVVQYDLDLLGKEIIIPFGSTLLFKNGSFKNGSIKGCMTAINGLQKNNFRNVFFSGSFSAVNLSYSFFQGYYDDTSLLKAMFDLLFSMDGKSVLNLESQKVYSIVSKQLEYGHAIYEYTDKNDKEIRGNDAVINDLRPRSLVGYTTYDGVFLFSHCHNIVISNLHYQNLNEDYLPLFDSNGKLKFRAGIENQIGYVGTSFILIHNNCEGFDIKAKITGARYGVKVGDYSKFWLSGDRGLTNSSLSIDAVKTGYPVAIELGDNLSVFIRSDTHHRAAYLCGISNSHIEIAAKNIYIAPYHCLLSDTHFASDKNAPVCFKACSNLDVHIAELGSTIVTNKNSFCLGFQTYNTPPFYIRKDPLIWSNINVIIEQKNASPNIGLFSFSRGMASTSDEPLAIRDMYSDITISCSSKFEFKQYVARIQSGKAGKYKNIRISIDAPKGTLMIENANDYIFDVSDSSVKSAVYSGKVALPSNIQRRHRIFSLFGL